MNHAQLVELMHAVLDGEATSDERRELEARLARDASARAQYDELRLLFDGLRRVPQPYAPEGLVASVMDAVPSRRPPRPDAGQLFSSSGVFEANLKKARGRSSGDRAPIHRVFQPWAFLRGDTMNEQNSGFSGKRKIVIGSGIAAAAVIVALSTGLFPPSNDTAGTIVPAERYRAPQITSEDVKVGGQSGGGAAPTVQTSASPGATLSGQGGLNGTGMGSNGGGMSTNGGGMNTNGGGLNTNGGGLNTNGGGLNTNGGGLNTNGGGLNTNGGGLNTNGGGMSSNGGGLNTNGGGLNTNGGGMSSNGGGLNTNGGGMSSNGGGLNRNATATNGGGMSTNGGGMSTNGGGLNTNGQGGSRTN
jgi:anti-sigma factor RsiW